MGIQYMIDSKLAIEYKIKVDSMYLEDLKVFTEEECIEEASKIEGAIPVMVTTESKTFERTLVQCPDSN